MTKKFLDTIAWRCEINPTIFTEVYCLYLPGRHRIIETKLGPSDVEYELQHLESTLEWLEFNLNGRATTEEITTATLEYILLLHKLKDKHESA